MLDTNMASALLKGHPRAVARLAAETPERLCVSVVTEAELLFGVAKRPEARKLRIAVDELLAVIEVLSWNSATARRYATIRTELERRGKPLGALDLLIAAHAVEQHAVLVTDDRAFGAVSGLRLEDWTQAPRPHVSPLINRFNLYNASSASRGLIASGSSVMRAVCNSSGGGAGGGSRGS